MARGREKQASLLFVPFRELFAPWISNVASQERPTLDLNRTEPLKQWTSAGWSIYGYMVEVRHHQVAAISFSDVVRSIKTHHVAIDARYPNMIEGLQVCFHGRKEKCLCRPPQPGLIHNAVYNHSRRWGGEGLISRKNVVVVGNQAMADTAGVKSIYLLTEFLTADPEAYFKGAA